MKLKTHWLGMIKKMQYVKLSADLKINQQILSKQRGEKVKEKEQVFRLQGSIKQSSICVIGIPEREETVDEEEKVI